MGSQWQFGAENFIGDATIYAKSTTDVVGYEATNLLNPFAWSRWLAPNATDYVIFDLGSAKEFDYCAIEVPNWPAYAGTIVVDASNDPTFATSTAMATFSYTAPASPYFEPAPRALWKSLAAALTLRYVRVRTDAAGAYFACLAVGNTYVPDIGEFVGLTPPKYSEDKDLINTVSEAGYFLGRTVIDRGVAFKIDLEFLSPSWVDTIGMRIIHILQTKPMFVAWPKYAAGTGGRCNHCWTDGALSPPVNQSTQFMKMAFKLRGV